MSKRFNVALSFPGEHRAYVKEMANALAGTLTKQKVFYDRFYEAELSRPNLDIYLQDIYHDQSELVVVVLCKEYDEKEWCGLEFRAIRDLIKSRRDEEIMFVRVADGDVKGVFGIDGYVDAQCRPATDIAAVICDRLKIGGSVPPADVEPADTVRRSRLLCPPDIALPTSGEFCFGREPQLKKLRQIWEDGSRNIVSIVARGGEGKTTAHQGCGKTVAEEAGRPW